MVKELSTYFVRSDGSCLGMSVVSSGARQGLQRSTETRRLESRPGRLEGMSRKRSLGSVVGDTGGRRGPAARILKGPIQLREGLILSTVVSVSFLAPWWIVATEL